MLRADGVDAVHITTPAQSHFPLGRLCLEAGCHVYVEKPFTVNAAEADELLDLARPKDVALRSVTTSSSARRPCGCASSSRRIPGRTADSRRLHSVLLPR